MVAGSLLNIVDGVAYIAVAYMQIDVIVQMQRHIAAQIEPARTMGFALSGR
jgi:hypothetical protein